VHRALGWSRVKSRSVFGSLRLGSAGARSAEASDQAHPEVQGARLHDAFISYSHRDREFAARLRGALEGEGKDIWMDETSIKPAAAWAAALERAIEASGSFVFLVSSDSTASPECIQELDHAVAFNKRLIPVRVSEVEAGQVPEALAARQFVPSRGVFAKSFGSALQTLLAAIDTDVDWVVEHTEWGQKAAEWNRRDRDRSFLLSGVELETAERWLAGSSGRRPEPSELQRIYILGSRQAATRRLRRTRGLFSGGMVITTALAVFAIAQERIAVRNQHRAESRQLAASAQFVLDADPELSTLLALRALRIAPTVEYPEHRIPHSPW